MSTPTVAFGDVGGRGVCAENSNIVLPCPMEKRNSDPFVCSDLFLCSGMFVRSDPLSFDLLMRSEPFLCSVSFSFWSASFFLFFFFLVCVPPILPCT